MELLLFADNMILYTEIPKDATETTRNNKQIKLQDKKKTVHKHLLCSYILTSIRKRNEENKPVYNGNEKDKIPRNSLNRGEGPVHLNYQTLLREAEDVLRSWIGRINSEKGHVTYNIQT